MEYEQAEKQNQSEETAGNPEVNWGIRAGITDGSRLGDYATREETVHMIAAALRYWTQCVFHILNERDPY